MHWLHTCVAGLPHFAQRISGGLLRASTRISLLCPAFSCSATTFRDSSVVVPKSYSWSNFKPGFNTVYSRTSMVFVGMEGPKKSFHMASTMPVSNSYRKAPIVNALKCSQHSSQMSRKNWSRSASFAEAGTSRCSQYSGRYVPQTLIQNVFCVLPPGEAAASSCRHFLRWREMTFFAKSFPHRLQVPVDMGPVMVLSPFPRRVPFPARARRL